MSVGRKLSGLAVAGGLLASSCGVGESITPAEVSEMEPAPTSTTFEQATGPTLEPLPRATLESEETESDYSQHLPPIDSDLWNTFEDPDGIHAITPLAGYDHESGRFAFHEDLPESYRGAIEAGILSPVMQYVIAKGYVSDVSFRVAKNDNAFFDPYDKGIEFDIGQGNQESRLYTHVGVFADVAAHEAGHAIAEGWYGEIRYGGAGIESLSPRLQELVGRSLEVCASIRGDILTNYFDGHREELASAYREAADRFTASAETGDRPERMARIAEVLLSTAAAVETGETYASGYKSDNTCGWNGVIDFPYIEATKDGDGAESIGEFQYEEQAEALWDLNGPLAAEARDEYRCINDGRAAADRLGLDPDRPGGHAYDNVTEFVASTVAIIQTNPGYIQRCLEELDPDSAAKMGELVGLTMQIIDETDPELIDVIMGMGEEQSEVIEGYLQS